MSSPPPNPPTTAATANAAVDAYARSRISPWTTREKIARALWMIVRATLFRWSWHTWIGWRAALLRLFGARLGRHFHIRPSARVEIPWNLRAGDYCSVGDHAIIYNLGPVTLGHRVSISQLAHLCAGTHDYRQPDLPLLRPPIDIEDDAWIAAQAFVGPGVRVGRGAIVGACAALFTSAEPMMIYRGNPASAYKRRQAPHLEPAP